MKRQSIPGKLLLIFRALAGRKPLFADLYRVHASEVMPSGLNCRSSGSNNLFDHRGIATMLTRFARNYIARHRNRANQLLHLIGVPMTFVVSIILLTRDQPMWAGAAFVGGYVLQFIGHAIEGNDAGELILVKKMLGKPYREFAPGYEDQSKSAD